MTFIFRNLNKVLSIGIFLFLVLIFSPNITQAFHPVHPVDICHSSIITHKVRLLENQPWLSWFLWHRHNDKDFLITTEEDRARCLAAIAENGEGDDDDDNGGGPVDVCLNIDGDQATVPEGLVLTEEGQCVEDVPQVIDVCLNIDGDQATVPEGLVVHDGGQCIEDTPPVIDVCPNIDGAQATIPEGFSLVEGQCVQNPVVVSDTPQGSTGGGGGSGGSRGGSFFRGFVATSTGEVLGAFTGDCQPSLTSYLRLGAKNDPNQVKWLQGFLNEQGFSVLETGLFDTATQKAVKLFQAKYKEQILKPWQILGLSDGITPTGHVYKTTRYFINNLVCDGAEAMPVLP